MDGGVYAIPDQEARTVAHKLVIEMFCQFSVPEQLHSVQGRQLKKHTTPYQPQSDGLIGFLNITPSDWVTLC